MIKYMNYKDNNNIQKTKAALGFTLVELLIVIIIIGILATLVIVTFTGVQQKARDSKRKTDINAVQSQIEAYYATNTQYPTLANLNDATFRQTNLKGLDPSALKDPKASSSSICASTSSTCYGYAVTPANCDNTTVICANYTLTATLEAGGTFSVHSNN